MITVLLCALTALGRDGAAQSEVIANNGDPALGRRERWDSAALARNIRGVNYVPSYARNDVQTWMDYDPAVVDLELGYAEKLRLNTVRVFLQFAVYESDPGLFMERFEDFLTLCDGHGIRMMPVLFDSCFGEFPDLENYRDKDWMANPGQNRLQPKHWPSLQEYVQDLVGRHSDDRRIVMWDIMNEPLATSFNAPEDQQLIWSFVDHFIGYVREQNPVQPLTVGCAFSVELPRLVRKVDVLAFHNYGRNLKEDIAGVKGLGARHGKPIVCNEVVGRPHQPFSFAMPILREEEIGWCFWELMIGRTQFSRGAYPYQGLVYPDGTCLDAHEIAHVADVTVEEARMLFRERPRPRLTEDGVTFNGFWTRWTGDGPEGGRLFFSTDPDSTAEWTFEGDRVDMVHKIGPDCGIALITIDGAPASQPAIDTYSAQVEWNHRSLLADGLPSGQHTIRVSPAGRKYARSSNYYIQIVGFSNIAEEMGE